MLPTQENLMSWTIINESSCLLSSEDGEDVSHLLFCPAIKAPSFATLGLHYPPSFVTTGVALIDFCITMPEHLPSGHELVLKLLINLEELWKTRNQILRLRNQAYRYQSPCSFFMFTIKHLLTLCFWISKKKDLLEDNPPRPDERLFWFNLEPKQLGLNPTREYLVFDLTWLISSLSSLVKINHIACQMTKN